MRSVGVGILDLPSSILAKVFSEVDSRTLLVAIPAVCRGWRDICKYDLPPVHLDVRWNARDHYRGNAVTDVALNTMAQRFRRVDAISVPDCSGVPPEGFVALLTSCPGVTRIDFDNSENIHTPVLNAVAAQCPRLTFLNLNNTCRATDADLLAVGAGCPRLQHLELLKCSSITSAGLANFAALTTLSVRGIWRFNTVDLNAVASSCPLLVNLNLDGTQVSLHGFDGAFPNLKILIFGPWTKLSETGLKYVLQGSPKLHHVGVRIYVTSEAIAITLAVHCAHLSYIAIPAHLTERGLEKLVDAVHAKPIVAMDFHHDDQLSEAMIVNLAAQCPQVSNLSFGGRSTLSDDFLEEVAAACPELDTLRLYNCSQLTGAGVEKVLEKCPKMTKLDVCRCKFSLPLLKRLSTDFPQVNIVWADGDGSPPVWHSF